MRWVVLLFLLWPLQAVSQTVDPAQTERDRSYLTGLIEDNLSGAGRQVRLEGFSGALSSRAAFDSLTIADEEGVWLTIRNGAMAWDRAALLLGRIAVQDLSAAEIDLPRLPIPTPAKVTPEATPFALPNLPVAVEIGSISAKKVRLGAEVLGQAAEVSLEGSMRLADGGGETRLSVTRLDGLRGRLSLQAAYANDSQEALIDLLLSEAAGGISAGLLGLPDTPSLTLSVAGVGKIDDFTADVLLGTAGAERLTGQITLSGEAAQRGFDVRLAGDVSPLLPLEYRDFFGASAKLTAQGRRSATGMLQLRQFDLRTGAAAVSGSLDLLPSGLPERFDLAATLGLPGVKAPVVLPVRGPKTALRGGTVSLAFDRARGDGWRLRAELNDLQIGQDRLARVGLDGSGRIGQPRNGSATVGGTLAFSATGLHPENAALAQALGPFVTGAARFFWQSGQPLSVPTLRLATRDFEANGRFSLAKDGRLSGQMAADHRSLKSLSALADRQISGSVSAKINGYYDALSGGFDGQATAAAQDLTLDQPQADALLRGMAQIDLSARRDETGLLLRDLVAKGVGLSLTASGKLSQANNDLQASFTLPDLGRLGPGHAGAISAQAALSGATGARQLTLVGQGRDLRLPQAELGKILAGQSDFSLALSETVAGFRLADFVIATPQLSAKASPQDALGKTLAVEARLANMALLTPDFPGPLGISGLVTDLGTGFGLDLRGTGPGGTDATVKGTLAANFSAVDLTLSGRTETALANAFIAPQSVRGALVFDLALRGKPGLAALSGQAAGRGLRLVAPTLGQALETVDLQARLENGRVQLTAEAQVEGGGRVSLSGPVALLPPFDANLSVLLDRARLRDPALYDTRISGRLSIDGGLAGNLRIGGALDLAQTELRIPSSGFGGATEIPQVKHLHEPAAVHATRMRAGLIAAESEARRGPRKTVALDILLSAPQQVFVRGRGLDAELGGALRLGGTTAAIVPTGEFSLLRGRLDMLGKRFALTEGQVALQGALVPWVLFRATTEQADVAITLTLEGEATQPNLQIVSIPDLPEEEVLALLLFGRGLGSLSPMQAAQLASAVATLAGKGGEGIVSRLRTGFGLDDLDIGADEGGNATLRIGKYLSENVYSNVAVDSDGKAEVTLNLDVTPNLTARGAVGSDGDSSLGLFFEKDY